jgi:conjugative relaxase-like TrwC/TraI family protein
VPILAVVADLHKLAVGREDYYTREIARNREEYLSGKGESPGQFHGGSAQALGLDGECSAEDFKRLFAWRDPRTGEQLGRAPRADAMPAWDLVFRPHKDVSILYALGDEATGRRVAEAHQAGVRAAVAYLDEQVGTRTGRHGAEHVQSSGLLAVGFTHRTSRAGDPLLHTHLIITNRTQGPDGQWRTLDSRDLLNHRATADAMYQAAYQQELTHSLGVRWQEPDRWGNRAIEGMPEELRRGFSKRHEQINAELERQEAQGKHRTPKLVQKVVHATRPAKSHETPETLYGRWQQEARELGFEPERLVREVTGRERSREQDPTVHVGEPAPPTAGQRDKTARLSQHRTGGRQDWPGHSRPRRDCPSGPSHRCLTGSPAPKDSPRRRPPSPDARCCARSAASCPPRPPGRSAPLSWRRWPTGSWPSGR